MRRCWLCEHRIWPWQRYGWFMDEAQTVYFHSRCWDEVHSV